MSAKNPTAFSATLVALMADIKIASDGKLALAKVKFEKWRKKIKTLAEQEKRPLAEEILVLAGRYFGRIGTQAGEAIAQLLVLVTDLAKPTPTPAAAPKKKPKAKAKKSKTPAKSKKKRAARIA